MASTVHPDSATVHPAAAAHRFKIFITPPQVKKTGPLGSAKKKAHRRGFVCSTALRAKVAGKTHHFFQRMILTLKAHRKSSEKK
jgi:hypothetical protein